MKNILATLLVLLAVTTAFGQKKEKEVSYKKIFYNQTQAQTDVVTLNVVDAVATEGEVKFKLRVTNKTNDFILFKPEECKFIIDGKETPASEKWLVVAPMDMESRVINLKGPGYNKIKNYSFVVDGLYRVSSSNPGIPAPDFRLPPAQNQFSAGSFSNSFLKMNKETDKTEVKFKCIYNGEKVGMIYPARIAVKMPDGKEYATAQTKSGPFLLQKGEDRNISAEWLRMPGGAANDMQKVDMIILWKDAFTEGTPEKTSGTRLELSFDEATSNDKGR